MICELVFLGSSSMGANLCSFGRSCVGGQMTAATSGDGFAIYELRKLRWWKREKRGMKREREPSLENQETKSEYLSLEELLLASPGPSEQGFVRDGQSDVSRHCGFGRKVHPSWIRDPTSISSPFDERSSVVVGRSVAETECSRDDGSFSICRSESGKMKKKVSFKLPEVSDVVLFYAPENDDSFAGDGNVVHS